MVLFGYRWLDSYFIWMIWGGFNMKIERENGIVC